MNKFTNVMLALAIAVFAGVGLSACDDDDATSNSSFTIQNN